MANHTLQQMRTTIGAWLRKLERYTKTDNVYLAKNASLVIATDMAAALNGFFIYLIAAHFLTKDVYGEYKYYISLFNLFAVVTYTSMETALTRAVSRGFDGSLFPAFRRKLLGGFVGSFIAVCAAIVFFQTGQAQTAIALILIAAFAPWIYAANLYASFLTGKKRFTDYSKLYTAMTGVMFVGTALAFIFLRNGLQIFAAFLVTSLCTLIAVWLVSRKRENTTVDHDMIPLATHLSLLDILAVIANNIDSVLAYQLIGPAALAVYTFAVIPAEQLRSFTRYIRTIAMPKFAVNKLADVKKTLPYKLWLMVLFSIVLVGIYILLVPFFFRWLFPAYVDSIAYSQAYSLSLIFVIPGTIILTLFQAQGLRKETFRFSVWIYSTQIALMVVGSITYGLWGLVVARILARLIMLVVGMFLLENAKEADIEKPAAV